MQRNPPDHGRSAGTRKSTHEREVYPDLSCNCARDTAASRDIVFHFLGLRHREVAAYGQALIAAGFINLYNEYQHRFKIAFWLPKIKALEHVERRIKPFIMADWKILSIFLGWIALLGIAFLVFMWEGLKMTQSPVAIQELGLCKSLYRYFLVTAEFKRYTSKIHTKCFRT